PRAAIRSGCRYSAMAPAGAAQLWLRQVRTCESIYSIAGRAAHRLIAPRRRRRDRSVLVGIAGRFGLVVRIRLGIVRRSKPKFMVLPGSFDFRNRGRPRKLGPVFRSKGERVHYSPATEPHGLKFNPFKSCTVPRPIGWLSSISPTGVANLAPYSQWQNLTFDPPMVMFAANQYPDGRRKDTVLNAESTGWFAWNMATSDLRNAAT